jgi:hypothetical protein
MAGSKWNQACDALRFIIQNAPAGALLIFGCVARNNSSIDDVDITGPFLFKFTTIDDDLSIRAAAQRKVDELRIVENGSTDISLFLEVCQNWATIASEKCATATEAIHITLLTDGKDNVSIVANDLVRDLCVKNDGVLLENARSFVDQFMQSRLEKTSTEEENKIVCKLRQQNSSWLSSVRAECSRLASISSIERKQKSLDVATLIGGNLLWRTTVYGIGTDVDSMSLHDVTVAAKGTYVYLDENNDALRCSLQA